MISGFLPYFPSSEFDIKRELGKAIHGVVSLAIYKPQNEEVVIKSVKSHVIDNPSDDLSENSRTEIVLAPILNKIPYFVTTYGAYNGGNMTHIVSSYCSGGDLFVKAGKLSLEEVRLFARQLFVGVKALHQSNLAHRDISLENILLHQDGSIRICDFGQVVRTRNPVTNESEYAWGLCGKDYYRPPEVYPRPKMCRDGKTVEADRNGKPKMIPSKYDAALVDIFSCGVVFFMLLVGCPPWEKARPSDPRFVHLQSHGSYSLLKLWQRQNKASPSLCNLIDRMIQINPARRPNLDSVLRHKFFTDYLPESTCREVSWEPDHSPLPKELSQKSLNPFPYSETLAFVRGPIPLNHPARIAAMKSAKSASPSIPDGEKSHMMEIDEESTAVDDSNNNERRFSLAASSFNGEFLSPKQQQDEWSKMGEKLVRRISKNSSSKESSLAGNGGETGGNAGSNRMSVSSPSNASSSSSSTSSQFGSKQNFGANPLIGGVDQHVTGATVSKKKHLNESNYSSISSSASSVGGAGNASGSSFVRRMKAFLSGCVISSDDDDTQTNTANNIHHNPRNPMKIVTQNSNRLGANASRPDTMAVSSNQTNI